MLMVDDNSRVGPPGTTGIRPEIPFHVEADMNWAVVGYEQESLAILRVG
jgi:hypothetical protein